MAILKKEKGKDKRGSINIKVENDLCKTQQSIVKKNSKVRTSDMDADKFVTTGHSQINFSNFQLNNNPGFSNDL